MVSLQESTHSQEESPNFEAFSSSKKRKWQEGDDHESNHSINKEPKLWPEDEQANIVDLHLDSPLPLEWQRCLDIKSGQIHFYNTRTHKKTSKDPRSSPRPSLNLELNLNLTCNPSSTKEQVDQQEQTKHDNTSKKSSFCSPSWISLDVDRQEMVAAVCMRCHMLVMMFKASPSCPNCKFVHPQGQAPSPNNLLNKSEFRLLCCKD